MRSAARNESARFRPAEKQILGGDDLLLPDVRGALLSKRYLVETDGFWQMPMAAGHTGGPTRGYQDPDQNRGLAAD